ncbi:TetR/AcrR family transcriptional regulator [Nonomuraea sp. NPDC050556]|uniref:TetR/AcrR family transcriptional regulator n=1 Tax=Nonomuraea sp. NPDC050556 TaxID=3364369 RepID=UPI00379BE35C
MFEARSTYHHGDLREALVRAGLEMARAEGAQAVVLREATRRAGVTARAAYRHFADREALVRAVAGAALTEMAATITRCQAGASDGLALLRGVGEGYIRFALDEPGWFDVAFFAMGDPVQPSRSPYHLLEEALRLLVGPDRVAGAAIMCWSGVHGFATLATRGPLRALPRAAIDAQGRELVDQLCDNVLR